MKKLFTPFEYASGRVYLIAASIWGVFAIVLWCLSPVLIPGPLQTLTRLWEFLSDLDFYLDILSSLMITIAGMLVSVVLACVIAFLTTMPAFSPLKVLPVLRFMSMAGFTFMFTLLLSGAYEVKIALLMLGIVPFFVLTLTSAITEIDQNEYDFWTTLGYGKWQQVYYILIRGKAELVLKAVKFNFAISWIMIGYIETYSMANGGIGVLLSKANGRTQIDKVLALQMCVIAFGSLFDYGLGRLRLALFTHVALAEKK